MADYKVNIGPFLNSVPSTDYRVNIGIFQGSFLPEIINQSIDQIVEVGDGISLFVTAIGTPPITYQWYKNGVPISGEVGDTISLTIAAISGGNYTCVATNVVGSDTSNIITITVLPYISSQTGNINIERNSGVSLSVTAVGTSPFTYQWYKDGILIPGANSSILTKFWGTTDAGTYKCRVTNVGGYIDSTNILVTIVSNPYRFYLFNIPFDMDRETP
jgi:hypothetical protein